MKFQITIGWPVYPSSFETYKGILAFRIALPGVILLDLRIKNITFAFQEQNQSGPRLDSLYSHFIGTHRHSGYSMMLHANWDISNSY